MDYLHVYKKVVGDWSADYTNAVAALSSDLDFLRRFQENRQKRSLRPIQFSRQQNRRKCIDYAFDQAHFVDRRV